MQASLACKRAMRMKTTIVAVVAMQKLVSDLQIVVRNQMISIATMTHDHLFVIVDNCIHHRKKNNEMQTMMKTIVVEFHDEVLIA